MQVSAQPEKEAEQSKVKAEKKKYLPHAVACTERPSKAKESNGARAQRQRSATVLNSVLLRALCGKSPRSIFDCALPPNSFAFFALFAVKAFPALVLNVPPRKHR